MYLSTTKEPYTYHLIIWTNPALENLNDIAEYIALSNLLPAKKLVAKIFDKVEHLEGFPESGKKPLELNNFNYWEVVENPCRIFYVIPQVVAI